MIHVILHVHFGYFLYKEFKSERFAQWTCSIELLLSSWCLVNSWQQNVKIRELEKNTFNEIGKCICFHFFLPKTRRSSFWCLKFDTKIWSKYHFKMCENLYKVTSSCNLIINLLTEFEFIFSDNISTFTYIHLTEKNIGPQFVFIYSMKFINVFGSLLRSCLEDNTHSDCDGWLIQGSLL